MLEYKGEHLAVTEDAERKEKLGKIWEEVSYRQCRFWAEIEHGGQTLIVIEYEEWKTRVLKHQHREEMQE